MVGDSIAGSLHIPTIKTATKAEVKLVKAYSSSYENSDTPATFAPRFPAKNFTDVLKNELKKTKVDALIIQSGSVDITNLKTETSNAEQYLEYFKQKTVISANNLFTAVTNAATDHPEVKKIILMKQIPRYDSKSKMLPGLKPYLSKLFNDTIDQLFAKCQAQVKNKVIIGNHNLECSGGIFEARYRNIQSNMFDSIHLYGPSGMKAFTASVLNILSSAQLVQTTPPKYYDQFVRKEREQARNQAKHDQQKTEQSRRHNATNDYHYRVPTYNKFADLAAHDNYQGNY